jgi:hypothetical protein
MAHFTRLIKVFTLSLLGLLFTVSPRCDTELKPQLVLIPARLREFNYDLTNFYIKNEFLTLQFSKGSINHLGFQGFWLDTCVGYRSWSHPNVIEILQNKTPIYISPMGYVSLNYQYANTVWQIHGYTNYHYEWYYAFNPSSRLPSRHTVSLGATTQYLKINQKLHVNAHILWPNQEPILGRQDQWRLDIKGISPLALISNNTAILIGPYYKRIQDHNALKDYWGINAEIILSFSGRSLFLKYNYDDHDHSRINFGFAVGARPITSLSPQNFM